MKKYLSVSVFIFVASSALAQHENCNHGDAPSTDATSNGKYIHASRDALESIGLKLAEVKTKNFEDVVMAIGRIENIVERVNSISSRIAGRVLEVYVSPDSFVEKGEPICKIESFLAGNPPPSVVLKAGESGIVEALNVVKGSGVESGFEVARIVDTSKLYAVANVFEPSISKLKIGDKARIRAEALGAQTIVNGTLVKFGSKLNASTNTLPVYFEIENKDGKIKSGMRVVFSIIASSRLSTVVPLEAVSEEDGLNYVYVQDKKHDGVLERRIVSLAGHNDISAEINHGLADGDKVVVKGIYQLRFMPRSNDSHNHSAENKHEKDMHAKEHNKKECTDASHNHSEGEHAELSNNDLHDHNHDHSKHHAEEEHSNHSTDKKLYLQNLVYIALGVSLLLNFIFAFAHRRRRGGDAR